MSKLMTQVCTVQSDFKICINPARIRPQRYHSIIHGHWPCRILEITVDGNIPLNTTDIDVLFVFAVEDQQYFISLLWMPSVTQK